MSDWLPAKIEQRTDWAEGLMTLRFDLVLDDFEPGQFVNLALDQNDVQSKRSYSIASAPGAPLELFLTRVSEGTVTPDLFDRTAGDDVIVNRRVAGFFTLSWLPPAKDLWLISTGTGLGPFISILRTGALWHRFEHVVLVHGARFASHRAYKEELDTLAAAQGDRLRYVSLVSREDAPGSLRGRITDAVRSGELERAAGLQLSPERSHVMLCGNPDMIKEMQGVLADRGLRKHKRKEPGHVTTEKYW